MNEIEFNNVYSIQVFVLAQAYLFIIDNQNIEKYFCTKLENRRKYIYKKTR